MFTVWQILEKKWAGLEPSIHLCFHIECSQMLISGLFCWFLFSLHKLSLARQKKKEIKKWKLKLNLVGLKLQNLNGPQQLFLIFLHLYACRILVYLSLFPVMEDSLFPPYGGNHWYCSISTEKKPVVHIVCGICRIQTQGERTVLLKDVLTWNPQQYFAGAEILSIKTQVLSAALTCSQWTLQEENQCWWPSSFFQFSQAQWISSHSWAWLVG